MKKKSDIAKQYELRATSFLFVAAVLLFCNSLLNVLSELTESGSIIKSVTTIFVILCSVAAYIMCFKGFSHVNKTCKLCEDNKNYYLGRNLMILLGVVIAMSVVLIFSILVVNVLVMQYDGKVLTSADAQAKSNLFVISALLNILSQIFAVSTPFIIYLWNKYKIAPKGDKTAIFALLTVVFMVVHVVISSLNSTYIATANSSAVLAFFNQILSVAKYFLLVFYFNMKNKQLKAEKSEEESKKA